MATLLIVTHFYCSAENVYCVTPTGASCASCPHNSTHCATLSEYALEAETYFISNTTMVFLPGDHALDVNITVVSVVKLTMRGDSSLDNVARVVCNGFVGFSFTNMVEFNIHSLVFTSYNRSWSYGSRPSNNFALLLQSTQQVRLVNCSFHDNLGTALAVHNTNITLVGNEFIHNQCACRSSSKRCKLGCGITAVNSTLLFTGNTTFLKNNGSRYCAGAIWASASSLHFTGTNNFIGNSAWYGGAIYAKANTLRFSGTSQNSVNHGGRISRHSGHVLIFSGTNNFFNNSAKRCGGALIAGASTSTNLIGTSTFSHNSAGSRGGAIITYKAVLTFIGTTNFFNNSANDFGGGAICTVQSRSVSFNGISIFIGNSASNGGAIFVYATSLSLTGTSSFSNNSAMQGGAILVNSNSTLTLNGNISFTNNGHNTPDSRGGAVYWDSIRYLFILSGTTVHWENNHANLGGAIYVFNSNPIFYCTVTRISDLLLYRLARKCFFQLPGQNTNGSGFKNIDVKLVFKNNSAGAAGSVLYGGAIDKCIVTGLGSGKVFNKIAQYEADNMTSSISSDPFRVCPCEVDNQPNCSKSNIPLSVYPGETFRVSLVTVGQRDGIVPSAVKSRIYRGSLQDIQQTSKICTTLNYTVFSRQNVSLELHPDGMCSTVSEKLLLQLSILQSCPPGFHITHDLCVCEQTLQKYTNNCNITNGLGQITRESDDTFWVGYDQSRGLVIAHPNCPFDHCVNFTVAFPLNSTLSDIQCACNRASFLCGACKENYSLVLGTSQCRKCTDSHLHLLIPFALMGIALVFLLLVCKLTVATGTLSGLIFYANIVRVNRTIFLPVKSTDALSVFIAWLNLDFGIETCFYNGMNAYSKAWLQFVFPVYILVLVGLVIVVSHFSQRFAHLLGKNPVAVLATLILLFYAKVLQALFMAVSFTNLEYADHSIRRVWLYDANIDYITGIHIPLFLVAVLVFVFLFLPYTLLLLFGQWLQALSHLGLFSWVNSARLKPFMDSYHAPYKAKHRYWPGLLLVLRFALLLVFAVNYQQDPSINLLAILVGTGILQLWAWVSGGVYKNWCLDALEGSFMLNMTILAVTTYHVKLSAGNQIAVGYTSIITALVTFIGIFIYHILQQLSHAGLWKKVNLKFTKKRNTKQAVNDLNNPINHTTEPVKYDQLREPWLEDLVQPTHSSV